MIRPPPRSPLPLPAPLPTPRRRGSRRPRRPVRPRLLVRRDPLHPSAPACPPLRQTEGADARSEEHTSELQSRLHLVCRLLLEKKKNNEAYNITATTHTTADI